MPRRSLPRLQPGDFLQAAHLNALYQEIERLNLTVGSNLILSKTKGGMALSANCGDQFWVKITGDAVTLASDAVIYPWTEQIPDASGAWADGPRSGTTTVVSDVPTEDAAMETNMNDEVPADSIVLVTRVGGVLGFLFRACA